MTAEERASVIAMVQLFLDIHADAKITAEAKFGRDQARDPKGGSIVATPNGTATLTIEVNGGARSSGVFEIQT